MSARRLPRARAAAALVTAAGALAAAGCAHVTHVGADGTLRVALGEYRVTPQDVQAPQGLLTIDVHNYGRLTHNLVITLGTEIVASTSPIPPGSGTELQAALIPGDYLMASTVLSDQALGAYGTLDVR